MTTSGLPDEERQVKQRNVLAVIPARLGSKGIPRKNLVDLGGRPLIAHSILAARQCALISRVIVTTDSEEIAEVSHSWGAEVPFLRPAELSHDAAGLGEVIDHAVQVLKDEEGYEPEAVITLCPTHPFRTTRLMAELTAMLLAGCRDVRTVRRIPAHEFSHFATGSGQSLRPMEEHNPLRGRQLFRNYGLYVGVRRQGECIQALYLHQLRTELELLDIDEPHHLARARELMLDWSPDEAPGLPEGAGREGAGREVAAPGGVPAC